MFLPLLLWKFELEEGEATPSKNPYENGILDFDPSLKSA
jgi:hypothetical protein